MLTPEGRYLTDWVLPDPNAGVFSPEQIAVSPDGREVYATDVGSSRIIILRVDRGDSRAAERDGRPQ
jgi:DNA-binding beta-propeller fold protein YncE